MSSNLHLEMHENIGVLTLDRPGAKINLLDRALLTELRDWLTELANQRELAGLVIISGKPGSFCGGVDLAVFEAMESAAEARALARHGQETFGQLAGLPVVTVAAIHGACLGGGAELALACTYRLLSDSAATCLGLPETGLGLIPCFGGTQRLPRLVGVREALRLLTGGVRLSSAEAMRLGLADEIVPREHLLAAARRLILAPQPARPADRLGLLDRLPPWRKLLFFRAEREARRGRGDHYPARAAAISAVAAGFDREAQSGLETEEQLLGEMAITDAAAHLQQVFRLRQSYARKDSAPSRELSRMAVVGGGMMGATVTALLAEKGLQPRLLNRSLAGLKKALGVVRDELATREEQGLLAQGEAARIMSRITYDTGLRGLRGQEVVVETVTENLGVKKAVLADIARSVPAETLVLTCTASLPIGELASAVVHPGRLAGLHLFNPTGQQQLIEVISGPATTEATRRAVIALIRQLGRLPVAVQDRPGFLLNRLLLPYLNEAARLLESGTRVEAIDRAMEDFGMATGPFALLDQIGLDVAAHLAESLHRAYGELLPPSPILARMVEAGRLGRKSGQGFYHYKNGRRQRVARDLNGLLKLPPPARKPMPPAEIVDRLLLAMLNEAARCLAEGVVAEPAAIDTALLFGAGFPPYTGGLLRYADDRSAINVVKKLQQLEMTAGTFYSPAELLLAQAEKGRRFYES